MSLAIFFDTNALRKKDLSLDNELLLITEHAKRYRLRLAISHVVCLELENQSEREVKYIKKFYSDWRRVFKRQMANGDEIFELLDYSSENYLYKPLSDKGFEIIDNIAEDIYIAINSMYKGLMPAKTQGINLSILGKKDEDYELTPYDTNYIDFKYKENGIKDVFIWRSALSILKSDSKNRLAFITSNIKDFCADGNPRELHANLASELVSGSESNVVLFSNMEDFRKYHLEFVEKFDLYAMEIFSYFDINQTLPYLSTDYGEFELVRVDKFFPIEVEGICHFSALINLIFKNTHTAEYAVTVEDERDMTVLATVTRKSEGNGSDMYSVRLMCAIDENLATTRGWTWPMNNSTLLEKLLELSQEQPTGEGVTEGA